MLDLGEAAMSEDDFRTLPRLVALEQLLLKGQQVTDGYVLHLASLELPALVSVSLYGTRITDTGMQQLCRTYNLEDLTLDDSRYITRNSVNAIGRMTNLRTLGVRGSGLSPSYDHTMEVQRLKNLLPQCRISYGD